ncbi:PD-(D/E)XK nuclease family protein [Planomonospora sp. ID91781]|uniref:PD-(D/E)XK nuclease family protein n=1 Tax=Planomonospora sp. ID91781 TaxID=2738135 RepID=UPI0018C3A69B|nr:PD-(D/E)XK nuclease family protein [Planomonospora sp. ID91781]MBG0823924.1 PD-(D/E)XK nuclease family protein [Planomonospora sp. ID91781]
MPLRTELTGNPDVVRLSASALDRRERDCPASAAAKAYPAMRPVVRDRRRYPPWASFPLGLVISALDFVECDGYDPDVAAEMAVEESRDPVHRGVARWIRHACRTYVETSESLAAELAAEGVELHLDGRPRVVQHGTRGASAVEMRALTAWGRWYASPDGSVVEFRRLRLRRPTGRKSDHSTLAMAYVAAAGDRVVHPRDVYQAVPIPVEHGGVRPQRIRVVEMGLTDADARVLVDAAPEEVRQAYLDSVRPVAARLLTDDRRAPGSDCAGCRLFGSCEALTRTPGLLGLPGPGTHRRTWSVTTARQYQVCPAQSHLRDLHLPAEEAAGSAVRRGLLVHQWLETAHGRPRKRPCTLDDLPDPTGSFHGLAERMMNWDEYQQIWPYLIQHVDVCPLRGPGEVTAVMPEPRVAAYDSTADVVVVANPDLLRRVDGRLVYREQKTSLTDRGITAENALELVPQLALAVCLIAGGVFGDTAGTVELEQLTPASGTVIELDAADPGVVTAARAVLAELAGPWHRDTAFRATPGPWCRFCPVSRWCGDASRADEGPFMTVDGLVIDPVTGEILESPGCTTSRVEAVTGALAGAEDDEPPF